MTLMSEIEPGGRTSAIVRKLGNMSFLSSEEVEYLEGIQNNTISLTPGSEFITDGEEFEATYIVRAGWAVRYVLLPSGRRQILSYALPGDILGLHVNFRRKASYSAAALTNVELAAVEPMRMVEIAQKFPVLASGISWCTAREFAILGDQAVRLGRLNAFERLCHLLAELYHRTRMLGEEDDGWLDFPMTQAEIADTLGLSLVHVNRQMSRLKKEDLAHVGRQRIRLKDISRLEEVSEFDEDHLAAFAAA